MKQRRVDPDAPPTSFEDWRNAHARRPTRSQPPKPPIAAGFTFHLFQASNNGKLFVVTAGRDPAGLVDCPAGGVWTPFKVFRETGEKRIGISEIEAKADIQRQGFHLMDLDKRHRPARRVPVRKPGLAEKRSRYRKAETPGSRTRKTSS
jgi:hypothetical protein